MEKTKEQKKPRHSKAKTVSKERKSRRLRNFFSWFRGHRKRKDYDKLKSPSENVSSSTDNIPNWSGESGVVNQAFLLDNVQVGGNCLRASLTSVVTAANSDNGNTTTNDVDECMSEVSAANSDESLLQNERPGYIGIPCSPCYRLQNTIQELSNAVARLGLEKEKQLLIKQYQREIHHVRLTDECKIQQLEKEIGKLNADISSLMEVNASLIKKGLCTEDDNSRLQDELQEQRIRCSDVESENTKLHQNMTILMQKLGKKKRELSKENDKNTSM
ncbi:uncharacterized protein LOC110456577 [Mizuhopecten yessoensis]|uniref:Uncharacterized protein n=1 Tax=Mizuhopecten yessoensis TaxID=6573 RepID=A0A210QAP5_MIZYE|nr:uncharacterized protein LOC110456577 [Mizuhopecten yessoensis]OWF45775.1 hypothetical protein KP79_PYT13058 [Mizuhopecten yessoensis]